MLLGSLKAGNPHLQRWVKEMRTVVKKMQKKCIPERLCKAGFKINTQKDPVEEIKQTDSSLQVFFRGQDASKLNL